MKELVKSMEKQTEFDQGLLPSQSKVNGGRALCGVDYVLDWLRSYSCNKGSIRVVRHVHDA